MIRKGWYNWAVEISSSLFSSPLREGGEEIIEKRFILIIILKLDPDHLEHSFQQKREQEHSGNKEHTNYEAFIGQWNLVHQSVTRTFQGCKGVCPHRTSFGALESRFRALSNT